MEGWIACWQKTVVWVLIVSCLCFLVLDVYRQVWFAILVGAIFILIYCCYCCIETLPDFGSFCRHFALVPIIVAEMVVVGVSAAATLADAAAAASTFLSAS